MQPIKGDKLPTVGGFYYSDNGGPSVSVSVAFPSPYNSIAVSATLGNSAALGKYIEAPTKTKYYKLYVKKV